MELEKEISGEQNVEADVEVRRNLQKLYSITERNAVSFAFAFPELALSIAEAFPDKVMSIARVIPLGYAFEIIKRMPNKKDEILGLFPNWKYRAGVL